MQTHRSLLLTLSLALWSPAALAGDVTVTLPAGDGFVVEDNTSTTERLRVDEATGNVSRNGALFVHTTGTDNTFVGEGAGSLGTTGPGGNSAFGKTALSSNTTGFDNAAFGRDALRFNTTAGGNSAFGRHALRSNTTGGLNSAFGADALRVNTTGYRNAAFGNGALRYNTTGRRNSAFGQGALFSNTTGYYNSAFGQSALSSNTIGWGNAAFGSAALTSNIFGIHNSAFGEDALRSNTSGSSNSAFGRRALPSNTTGFANAAFGAEALSDSTTGRYNAAFGRQALFRNTTGENNSAFGMHSLFFNTTGSRNVALGTSAGGQQTTGNDNIYIANSGTAAESGKIKIGNTAHTATYIEGIDGVTLGAGSAVYIDTSNQLGTAISSSLRTKTDVVDMGDASDVIEELRPVLYRYRADLVGESQAQVVRYGLIAEEVAQVAPHLVTRDAEGQPNSVQYRLLSPLLLNEVQKERRTNREQQQKLAAQERTIETLLARVEMLEARAQP